MENPKKPNYVADKDANRWEPYEEYILRKKYLAAKLMVKFGLYDSSYDWDEKNYQEQAAELVKWYHNLKIENEHKTS